MSRRVAIWIASISFALLVLLHMDFWRPQRTNLLFGWLPEELAYRVVFLLLAWLYMLFLCAQVWREDPD